MNRPFKGCDRTVWGSDFPMWVFVIRRVNKVVLTILFWIFIRMFYAGHDPLRTNTCWSFRQNKALINFHLNRCIDTDVLFVVLNCIFLPDRFRLEAFPVHEPNMSQFQKRNDSVLLKTSFSAACTQFLIHLTSVFPQTCSEIIKKSHSQFKWGHASPQVYLKLRVLLE